MILFICVKSAAVTCSGKNSSYFPWQFISKDSPLLKRGLHEAYLLSY
jgi:hypothetical protein